MWCMWKDFSAWSQLKYVFLKTFGTLGCHPLLNKLKKKKEETATVRQPTIAIWWHWTFGICPTNHMPKNRRNTFSSAVIYGTVKHRRSPCAPFVFRLRQIPGIFFQPVLIFLFFSSFSFFPSVLLQSRFSSLISSFAFVFSCSSLGDTEHSSLISYPNTLWNVIMDKVHNVHMCTH